jgi:excisionase family DNA binding protein
MYRLISGRSLGGITMDMKSARGAAKRGGGVASGEEGRQGPQPVKVYVAPGEAAAILHVDANTLARWANLGKLHVVRTPGGHRRYLADEVDELARNGFWATDLHG